MLDYLRGVVTAVGAENITLDVNGLGFSMRVCCPAAFSKLMGKKVRIPVYLDMSGDRPNLFGFEKERERAVFDELLKLEGIGPVTAIRLLSNMNELKRGETGILAGIRGLGPEKRKRILKWLGEPEQHGDVSGKYKLVREALVSLGMGTKEAATRSAKTLRKHREKSIESLVRLAVKGT